MPGCRDPRDEESGEVVLGAKKLDMRDARDIAIPVCHGIVEIGLEGSWRCVCRKFEFVRRFLLGEMVLCQAPPFGEGTWREC